MSIINDDFMLTNEIGKILFHTYARDLPIIDYHCHLNPEMIAKDYRFQNAYDLFLSGDHYKWRQMRNFGIEEDYITGNREPYEKWLYFARVMPYLIGNPLYHWTALELKRYFDINETLTEESAKRIWDACNERLQAAEYSAQSLIAKSHVETICTTDDPADDLQYHRKLRTSPFSVKVLPTFRPDRVINIDAPSFLAYIQRNNITSYRRLLTWIKDRIGFFHENGCRLSDQGLDRVPYRLGNAEAIFNKKLAGDHITTEEVDIYKTAVIIYCAKEYAVRNWTMQFHMGALRNNNKIMLKELGPDTGFDSINDLCIAENLSAVLGDLDAENQLPKTILYTLHPKDNYVLGTMIGNFQRGPLKSKVQFGSGWWFNDNQEGMEAQMKSLANVGVLGAFVGMLTDSRSFVSYPRHEYFRRILCNMLGEWVEKGYYPKDMKYLGKIVQDISYYNAKAYFGF
ncbi:MAG: glucuronate isomerase [Ruminococcaceae bacterium]|nr:glucuronate isomerase [Oscillospiraceae bacterium]